MPQQRRAQVTRHAIVLAAAEEFDRASYAATPLSAILRRGGVTKGAFYFHFPSKQAVASALVRLQAHRWSQLQKHWLDRGLDPLSTAVRMVDDAVRLLERDVVIRAGTRLRCQRVASTDDHTRHPDWEVVLRDLLTRSAERGVLRAGVDPAAAERVLWAALVGVLGHFPITTGASARVAEIWTVVLEGIASPEWLCSNSAMRSARPEST